MRTVEQHLTITTPDGAMPTFVARPEGHAPAPAVLVYMDALGLRETKRDIARRLAANGYVALLPNLYYRFGEDIAFDPAKISGGDPDERARCAATMLALSDDMAVSDTRAVLEHLDADETVAATPKGAMGFCMGGRFVVRAMARIPDAFAAGSALFPTELVTDGPDSPHLDIEHIRGALYLAYGAADLHIPLDAIPPVRELLERHGVPHEIDVCAGADHGFIYEGEPEYQAAAAERAWERTLDTFARTIGGAVTRAS